MSSKCVIFTKLLSSEAQCLYKPAAVLTSLVSLQVCCLYIYVIFTSIFSLQVCRLCLADPFNRTSSQLLWEASSHAAVNAQKLFVHKYPPLPDTHSYRVSKLEQCRMNKLAFDTATQGSNLGSLSREYKALATRLYEILSV